MPRSATRSSAANADEDTGDVAACRCARIAAPSALTHDRGEHLLPAVGGRARLPHAGGLRRARPARSARRTSRTSCSSPPRRLRHGWRVCADDAASRRSARALTRPPRAPPRRRVGLVAPSGRHRVGQSDDAPPFIGAGPSTLRSAGVDDTAGTAARTATATSAPLLPVRVRAACAHRLGAVAERCSSARRSRASTRARHHRVSRRAAPAGAPPRRAPKTPRRPPTSRAELLPLYSSCH